ncbi:hypothetical protein [Maridesulfovibrio ferrireducens]|uniref:VgrG-related protein n=1 Tax=Maridesulfovibrio ferrireducens TaxID=246191 RepID=UPI001A1FDA1E|nr:hypothetical protein [Maridesulfovibrio ferrireducens]MBI9111511.1 hypothetical protein [Maridesulfovibrio ferrireducens]
MTNINDNIATVMKVLGNSSGTAAGAGTPNLAALKNKAGSFDMEMEMAGRMFSEGRDGEGYSAQGMDMGVMNNALMLEALTALNSIKGLQKNEGRGSSPFTNNPYSNISNQFDVTSVKNMSMPDVVGDLSAKFESGAKGVSAIGYDRVGGTSYGKYQIASNTGTMDKFIEFLKDKAPHVAERLEQSGPANTGSKNGHMPDEWRKIAAEDSAGFEKLQHDFIRNSHYDPAAKKIFAQTGIDINNLPGPLREVLWSTSVQHGATGASNLISRALDKLSSQATEKGFPANLVKEIYGERKEQFASSTGAVQESVAKRLTKEQNMVLTMLEQASVSKLA